MGRYCWSSELCVQCEALDFWGSDIQESENIASLHNQITACDAVLEVGGPRLWPLTTLNLSCPLLLFFLFLFFVFFFWQYFLFPGQMKICCLPGLLDPGVFTQTLGGMLVPVNPVTCPQCFLPSP